MAINIPADKHTEKLLAWLAKHFNTSKAEMVRMLIREKYQVAKEGFSFGAFSKLKLENSLRELKELDNDHDLD